MGICTIRLSAFSQLCSLYAPHDRVFCYFMVWSPTLTYEIHTEMVLEWKTGTVCLWSPKSPSLRYTRYWNNLHATILRKNLLKNTDVVWRENRPPASTLCWFRCLWFGPHQRCFLHFAGSHGPGSWASSYPECAEMNQSPVDISDKDARVSSECQELTLEGFEVPSSNKTSMKNTGKTGQWGGKQPWRWRSLTLIVYDNSVQGRIGASCMFDSVLISQTSEGAGA